MATRKRLASVWQRGLAAAEKRMPPGNPFGAVGYGIGKRRVGRAHKNERALVVFVQTKEATPVRAIPTIAVRDKGRRKKLPLDVRATGVIPRALRGGDQRPHGLGCGSPILIPVGSTKEIGGVACLLGNTSGPTHLITAGHLFVPNSLGAAVLAGLPGQLWSVAGHLARNLLDEPQALDGALIELTLEGQRMAKETRVMMAAGSLKLPAPAGARDVMPNESVYAFPSTRGEWSAATGLEPLDALAFHLIAPRRGTFTVRSGIRTLHALTVPGDSGSGLLVEQGDSMLLVGLCSGGDASGSCFTNASEVASSVLTATPPATFMWG